MKIGETWICKTNKYWTMERGDKIEINLITENEIFFIRLKDMDGGVCERKEFIENFKKNYGEDNDLL